jgi:hypothetical protein
VLLSPGHLNIRLELVANMNRGTVPADMWARTTTVNLARRLESIHFVELPRCFQEAILVTLALNIRYLWYIRASSLPEEN